MPEMEPVGSGPFNLFTSACVHKIGVIKMPSMDSEAFAGALQVLYCLEEQKNNNEGLCSIIDAGHELKTAKIAGLDL